MTNLKRLLQKLNTNNALEYSLDQINDYGILKTFNLSIDETKNLISQFQKEFNLKNILAKDENSKILVDDNFPEEITATENDLNFLIKPKEAFEGINIDQIKIRGLIGQYSKNREVLDLFSSTGTYSLYSLKNRAAKIDSVENILSDHFKANLKLNEKLDNKRINLWEYSYIDFINMALDTGTQYDMIILDCSINNLINNKIDLKKDHLDLIRKIQNNLLREPGYLFFITNEKDFVMDPYIRKGADKITKSTIPEIYLPLMSHQAFVFYN